MTLTELQDSVYSLTKRADLSAQTLLAIQAATLKLHQVDYFYKDLFETGVSFVTSDYTQQIEYRTLIPRWRSLKYIRKTDSTGVDDLGFFDIILPELVLDAYKVNRDDVCYVAGNEIQLRSATSFQYAILGCYLNPDITEATFNSWIALDHPFAIIYEAASVICRQTGKLEEMNAFMTLALEQKKAVIASNILAQGY